MSSVPHTLQRDLDVRKSELAGDVEKISGRWSSREGKPK